MSDDVVEQDEAVTDAAPVEGNAVEGVAHDDAAIADNVDGLAVEKITSEYKSPQPAGVDGDPIGEAEDHLASLDMEAERKKAADLMRNM